MRTFANGFQRRGRYSLAWDGRTGMGERLPGGVYFLKLTSGDRAVTEKVVLLK